MLDIETYKKIISTQLNYEDQLIKKIDTDDYIKNKEFVKQRIQNRIDILKTEIEQNIEQENDEEEEEVKEDTNESNKLINRDNDNNSSKSEEEIKPEEIKLKESKIKVVESPKKIDIKDKILHKKVLNLIDEYKKALEYFMRIESQSQAEDARGKLRELSKAQNLLEKGKDIDEFALPINVSPDYICNMSAQERLNSFSKIIKDFSARKNELNEKLNKTIEKYKSGEKKDIVKNKDLIKKTLDDIKVKVDTLSNIISKLTEMAKNPYVPAPLYSMKEEEESVEKINDAISDQNLLITIGKVTCPRLENGHLNIVLPYSNEKQINELINKKSNTSDFEYSNSFKFEKNEYNNLYRKVFKVVLIEKSGCMCFKSAIAMAEANIKLDPLKNVSEIDSSIELKALNEPNIGKEYGRISIKFNLRTPLINKEYINVSKALLTITKTFPPFSLDKPLSQEPIPETSNKAPTVIKKVEEVKELKIDKNIKPVNPRPIVKKDVVIDPSEFKKEELVNPDIIDNLNSLKVLEMKIKKCEEEAAKIDGRMPAALREKLLRLRVKHKVKYIF